MLGVDRSNIQPTRHAAGLPHALCHGECGCWSYTFQWRVPAYFQAGLDSGSYRIFLVELARPRIELELADQADNA